MKLFLLSFFVLICISSSFYTEGNGIEILTDSNFDSKVMKSNDPWVVEFYSPNCGHCQNLTPEWKKAAIALKGYVHMGVVDVTANQQLSQKYEVKGVPSIKLFGVNKNQPGEYNGQREATAIVKESLNVLRSIVKAKLDGKINSDSGSKKEKSSEKSSEKEPKKESMPNVEPGKGEDIVILTDQNFKSKVLDSEDVWIVEFYAPWCGHCKQLAPHFAKAASALKKEKRIHFATVDSTVETSLAGKYAIQGYPSIKIFAAGPKFGNGNPQDYSGGRSSSDFIKFAENEISEMNFNPEATELTTVDEFSEYCVGKKICVIAFLPHILDSGKSGRNEYLSIVKNIIKRNKKSAFTFLWCEGGVQSELEDRLQLSFGYPAVVAISSEKNRYAVHRGSFSVESLQSFMTSMMTGRAAVKPIPGDISSYIKNTEKWDGEDGKKIEEPPIDLSDL